MRVSTVSLFVCIFSLVLKQVLNIKHPNCTRRTIYVHALPVSLLACIFSRALSLAIKQHSSCRKKINEMNASLMRVSVKLD